MIEIIIGLVIVSSVAGLAAVWYAIKHPQKEAKALEDQKTEFLVLAAHYLLTPLSVIKGTVSELLNPAASQMSASVRTKNYIAIQARTNELLRLVQNISTITSIDTGKLQVFPSAANIIDQVDNAITEIHAEAGQKNIAVRFNRPQTLEIDQVQIDTEKMRQVLSNILSNAVKFTAQNGTIEVTLQEKEKGFDIICADTGIGIASHELPRLFTRFHRGTSYLNLDYEGMGLGLYIAKYLIEAHGGKITMDSQEKVGTTVTLFLPK